MKLSRISLVKRLSFFQIVAISLVMGTFTVVLSSLITQHIEDRTESNLKEQVALLANMISTYHSALAQNADALGRVFRGSFPGELAVPGPAPAAAGERQVPLLKWGSRTANGDTDIVDSFHRLTQADASVFVRSGDDFIRVTTSALDEKGSRMTGTPLDRTNPAYPALLRGESFTGKASLNNRDYMASYTPVRDAQGRTVAAVGVMIDFTASLKAFADKIVKIKIGKTGYIYAMDAQPGPLGGTLRIHPTLAGKNIIASKDAHGVEFFRDMLNRKQGVIRYWWINQALGETKAREKLAAFDYLKEWDWVIVAGSYRDELNTEGVFLRNAMLLATVLVTVLLVSTFVVVLRRWVSLPLQKAVRLTSMLANGDFREVDDLQIQEYETKNEVEQLERGISTMAQSLCGLLANVRDAAAQLTDASQSISASARRSSETSENQSGKTTQVATAMLQMSATVEEVSRNSQEAAEAARAAATTAREGGKVVSEALSAMSEIASSTQTVSAKIGELGQSSNQIGAIASVISDIAGQTNLLALNAAIEAARAGEQGRGFAVVAGEVRRLAERTAAATQEITGMIESIQRAAREAVDAMHGESEQVSLGVAKTKGSGEALDRIIDMAGRVGDMVAHIATAASQQSEAAEEVNGNVSHIASMTAESSGNAAETARACVDLSSLALSLQTVVGQFKLNN